MSGGGAYRPRIIVLFDVIDIKNLILTSARIAISNLIRAGNHEIKGVVNICAFAFESLNLEVVVAGKIFEFPGARLSLLERLSSGITLIYNANAGWHLFLRPANESSKLARLQAYSQYLNFWVGNYQISK